MPESKNREESNSKSVVPLLGRSERPKLSVTRRQRPSRRSPVNSNSMLPAGQINTNNKNIDNSSMFQPTSLRRVPVLYPIAKTSRTVEDEHPSIDITLLARVASRIMDCLRILSIHATYDNANATASLTTIEGIRMQLCLWDVSSRESGNNGNEFGRESVTNGNNCRKILVELQRWSGDTMLFHRYSRDILKAAAGLKEKATLNINDDNENKSSGKNSHPLMEEEKEEEEYEKTMLAMESAHSLLMKDRIDAKHLGLESLLFITDPQKNGDLTATKFMASQVILFGAITRGQEQRENKDLLSTTTVLEDIHKIILSLVRCAPEREEDRFRNLALSIFGNALDVFNNHSGARSSCGNIDIHKMQYHESLVPALATELSRRTTQTGTSPHTTYLLTRCLRQLYCSLSKYSDNINVRHQFFIELSGEAESGGLHRAMDIGAHSHQKLELECKQFLEELSLKQSN